MKIPINRLLLILLGSIAINAHADPITGQVNIQSGSVVLSPNELGDVLSVGGSTDGKVTSVSGDYPSSLLGDTVTYQPFSVAVGTQSVSYLWLIDDSNNGFDYFFTLGSITSVVQSPTNLFLNGAGVLGSTDPSLSNSAGLWSYGINSSNGGPTDGIFSFQSNNSSVNAVPDRGGTTILIGLGLISILGVGLATKRKRNPVWAAA